MPKKQTRETVEAELRATETARLASSTSETLRDIDGGVSEEEAMECLRSHAAQDDQRISEETAESPLE